LLWVKRSSKLWLEILFISLVKFLELSGVGRVMADGTDEDGAYAARMDEWVAWETVERVAPRGEG
jgi:hypothetical protein